MRLAPRTANVSEWHSYDMAAFIVVRLVRLKHLALFIRTSYVQLTLRNTALHASFTRVVIAENSPYLLQLVTGLPQAEALCLGQKSLRKATG